MSKDQESVSTKAIFAVIKALEPLSGEDRMRVLQSAAAFFGVVELSVPAATAPASAAADNSAATAEGGKSSSNSAGSGKKMSIVELLDSKSPVTNSQRIACFAYYRDKVEGQEQFTSLDLSPYFKQAKLAAPANYSRDYNNAVREGWIHDDGSKSYLTRKGESAVDAGFAGKGKVRGTAVTKRKKAGKSE